MSGIRLGVVLGFAVIGALAVLVTFSLVAWIVLMEHHDRRAIRKLDRRASVGKSYVRPMEW